MTKKKKGRGCVSTFQKPKVPQRGEGEGSLAARKRGGGGKKEKGKAPDDFFSLKAKY